MAVEHLREKYLGMLLGGAIGDVLGSQNENLSFVQICVRGFKSDFPPKALYTDDTEMTLVLGKHILETNGDVDVDSLHASYKSVIQSSLRGYSAKTRFILSNWTPYRSPPGSASTNGALMRISPLSLVHHQTDADLRRKIRNAVYCTHGDNKDAIDAAFVYVKLLKSLIYDQISTSSQVYQFLLMLLGMMKNGRLYSLIKLTSFLKYMENDNVTKKIFGYEFMQIEAIDCLVCAVFCFTTFFDEPVRAVTLAANLGGDTDTIAKLVGELVGAKHGTAWIPEHFKTHEGKEELTALAYSFWKRRVE